MSCLFSVEDHVRVWDHQTQIHLVVVIEDELSMRPLYRLQVERPDQWAIAETIGKKSS